MFTFRILLLALPGMEVWRGVSSNFAIFYPEKLGIKSDNCSHKEEAESIKIVNAWSDAHLRNCLNDVTGFGVDFLKCPKDAHPGLSFCGSCHSGDALPFPALAVHIHWPVSVPAGAP